MIFPGSWEHYLGIMFLSGVAVCLLDTFVIRRRVALLFLLVFGAIAAAWSIYMMWGVPIDPRDVGRGNAGIIVLLVAGVLVVPMLAGYLAMLLLLYVVRNR